MKTATFFVLSALLFSFTSAISSSEALDKLSQCVKTNHPDVMQSLKPIEVQSASFWTFSYPLSSKKSFVAAIDDSTGERLTDEAQLTLVATNLYDQGLVEELKSKGYSAPLLQAAIAQSFQQSSRQLSTIEVFREQTEKKYPALSFQSTYDSLTRLANEAERLDNILRDAKGYQQSFESDLTDSSLSALLESYNISFDLMESFFSSYEEYQKEISNLESEVYKSSIPDPDNKNIYSNLENLRDIGISQLYAKVKASSPKLIVNKYDSGKTSWVTDAVASYFYIDTKCNAEEQYQILQQDYYLILANEQVIKNQGLGSEFENFKTQFAELTRLKNLRSPAGYKLLLQKIPETQLTISMLKDRFKTINPTATPSPKKSQDFTDLLLLAALIGIAAYAVMKFRQPPTDLSPVELDAK